MEPKERGQVRLKALEVELVELSNWSPEISRELESLRLKEEMVQLVEVVVVLEEDLSSTSSEAILPLLSLSRATTGLAHILLKEVRVAHSVTMLDTCQLKLARLE